DEDDAPLAPDAGERCIESVAPHIVHEDVDAVGAEFGKTPPDLFRLVVDAGIEPEILGDPAAFLGAAGDPDDAAALDPGELPGGGAHGAGGARYHHRLAALAFTDVEEAEIGGEPRDAEHAKI